MAQIQKRFLAANAVDETKIRLANLGKLKARNAADSADIEILFVNASDRIQFSSLPQVSADPSAGNDLARKSWIDTQLSSKVNTSSVGAAGGVASLDGGGKVPVSQLPNSIMQYQGLWNASTNSPSLADGAGNDDTAIGDVYRVSTAGSQDLGSGSISFSVGDYVILNASKVWEKADTTDSVVSVNGQTGAVTLTTTNISEGDNLYWTSARFDTAFSSKSTTNLSEGSNLYFTDARAKAAAVADSITNGVTDVAPSQNAVFDALALKADDSVVVKTVNGQSPTTGAVTLTTTNISEGTNLYWTSGRFDTAFSAKSTTNLSEGTNLYFTDARAKSAAVVDSLAGSQTDQAPSVSSVKSALDGKISTSAVDGSTVKLNGSSQLEALKKMDQLITLGAGDITNQYIDLSFAAHAATSISLTPIGGCMQERGVDFTVSLTGGASGVTRITFAGDLATGGNAALISGDKLVVSYSYL